MFRPGDGAGQFSVAGHPTNLEHSRQWLTVLAGGNYFFCRLLYHSSSLSSCRKRLDIN